MKKILVLTVMFDLVIFSVAAYSGSGALTVFGYIGEGAKNFSVLQDQLLADSFNLRTNADIQSDGDGSKVGSWTFTSDEQLAAEDYTVTYTFGELSDGTSDIEYELLIAEVADNTVYEVKNTAGTTSFNATSGDFTLTKDVLVRLTTQGESDAIAAGPGNYTSSITLNLTTDV
jgi:hypothetical protein